MPVCRLGESVHIRAAASRARAAHGTEMLVPFQNGPGQRKPSPPPLPPSFLPQGPGQRSFDSRIARWREIMSKNSKETLRHRRWRGWESGAVGREPVARLGALPARPHPPLPFPLPWPFGGSSFHSPFLDLLPSGGKIHILGYLNYEFSSLPWPSGRSIL